MQRFYHFILFVLLLLPSSLFSGEFARSEKVLICGVCRNVSQAVPNTIENIEKLGAQFNDYAVIIYENNSGDNTVKLFREWSKSNPKVTFFSERLERCQLPLSRTERIARARNIVLSEAREPQYAEFKYLIMVDLDFTTPWPIDEIVKTIETPGDWDCVAANGIRNRDFYYDRYAFRNCKYPFGPELLSSWWWEEQRTHRIYFEGTEWIPVFSAFSGLAIYKTASILSCSYSGAVTRELKKYYKQIVRSLSSSHHHLVRYKEFNNLKKDVRLEDLPIYFCENTSSEHPPGYRPITCCEHVPLHAEMALNGHEKIYINPQMYMYY